MLTAYIVIGIIMFMFSTYCILTQRELDGWDVLIGLIIFGSAWPLGVGAALFSLTIDALNKLRK